MFCQSCGSSHDDHGNFCKTCGAALLSCNTKEGVSKSKSPTASCSNANQPLSFKAYMEKRDVSLCSIQKRKKDERSEFINKKRKRDEIVKVNIGMVELEGRQLKIKRGSLLPIEVKKTDTHVTVKQLGIEKQCAHNKQLRDDEKCEWVLLYPDFDFVLHLPGTEEPFSIVKYKESLGRPFSRVNLFICRMLDYEIANGLNDSSSHSNYSVSKAPPPVPDDGWDALSFSDVPDSILSHSAFGTEDTMAMDLSSLDFTVSKPSEVVEVKDEENEPTNPVTTDCEMEPQGSLLEHVQLEESQHEITFDHMDVIVHRTTLLKDLIAVFCDPQVLSSILFVKVVDINGMEEQGEGRGVLRDVLTEFWHLFFQSLAIGAVAKVPVIRHDFQKQQWKAIARIMLYGYCKEGIFPVAISPVFIASCIHGEDSISDEMLLEAFKMYVSEDEREVITGCLEDSANVINNSELLEVLSSYKCYRVPTQENFQDIVCQLAHQELVQRPRYVANCWNPVLQPLQAHTEFLNTTNIHTFYQEKKPTAKKVIKMLQASPVNDAQRITLEHLTRFIKSLGGNVASFLQFTTGASVILDGQKIKVSFTELNGLARRPVAHTCGLLLEIPSTYQCYNELVEEFSAILRDKSAWEFNIV